jgi:hypothetical protein
MAFYGIIVEQSLKDVSIVQEFVILGDKQVGSWRLLLVSVPEAEINQKMKKLQNHMIGITEDCWYAHFFKDETLYVVYQDNIFQTTVFPQDWDEEIQHGMTHGIPIEQLDFRPRTIDDAIALFGLTPNAREG